MSTPANKKKIIVLLALVLCLLSSFLVTCGIFFFNEDDDGPGTGTGPGKLYYGGDSNLGRDGRDACNMTDDDKKYACDNDSELVGIGSGPTCGHKYYITDKGQGHISGTDERYSKFYSCAKNVYI